MAKIILVIFINFSGNADWVLQTLAFNSGKVSIEKTLQGLVCSNIDFYSEKQKLKQKNIISVSTELGLRGFLVFFFLEFCFPLTSWNFI